MAQEPFDFIPPSEEKPEDALDLDLDALFESDFRADFDEETENAERTEDLFESSVGFLSSLIFHLIVLIFLLFLSFPIPLGPGRGPSLSMEFTQEENEDWFDDLMESSGAKIEADSEKDASETEMPSESETELPEEEKIEVPTETKTETETFPSDFVPEFPDLENASPTDPNAPGTQPLPETYSPNPLQTGSSRPSDSWTQPVGPSLPSGGGMGPRTDSAARGQALEEAGGNAKSEEAVEMGLAWIARHQQFDSKKRHFGSWNFDLSRYGTPNSGEATSRTAATSLALLALLGHGNTREQGTYKKSVQDGIYYLSTQAKSRATQPGYDFRDSPDSRGMYGHVLATLALCEAYTMEESKDPNLRTLAQGGLQWLLYAQNPDGGGWRYQPLEAGDVSVTTWVVMVLKSAQNAGFEVPVSTLARLGLFLDSIASEKKAQYSYQPHQAPIPSTTAMGLCARVYSGTPRSAELLTKGTKQVADWGCDDTDLYYNYYATLLLRHYGGPLWRSWNEEMRDYLILTQEQYGAERGSWFFTEPHKTNNQIGGRLYTTAMAVMILEVYYRYLPIYGTVE